MHQPAKWWIGLIPLALIWVASNFIKMDSVEADLTGRVKPAVAAIARDVTDKAVVTSAGGRDIMISGLGANPQAADRASAQADAVFGVRKVVIDQAKAEAPKPQVKAAPSPAVSPAPVPQVAAAPAQKPACRSELVANFNKVPVLFPTGSATLTAESVTTLSNIASRIKDCPGAGIFVKGYTDSTGNLQRNQQLSKARAQAVVDFLVGYGIDAGRISTTSYGQDDPVATNDTSAGKAQNRRVEVSGT